MSFPVLVLHTFCIVSTKHSLCHHYILKYVVLMLPLLYVHRAVGIGGGGMAPLQILADQLTLFQPGGGGQIMPTTILRFPSDFKTLLRH